MTTNAHLDLLLLDTNTTSVWSRNYESRVFQNMSQYISLMVQLNINWSCSKNMFSPRYEDYALQYMWFRWPVELLLPRFENNICSHVFYNCDEVYLNNRLECLWCMKSQKKSSVELWWLYSNNYLMKRMIGCFECINKQHRLSWCNCFCRHQSYCYL